MTFLHKLNTFNWLIELACWRYFDIRVTYVFLFICTCTNFSCLHNNVTYVSIFHLYIYKYMHVCAMQGSFSNTTHSKKMLQYYYYCLYFVYLKRTYSKDPVVVITAFILSVACKKQNMTIYICKLYGLSLPMKNIN